MKQQLTNRETEVLYYVSQGLTNKEVGEILHVTYHTIKAHLSAALYKLECKNRTEAVLYADRNGLFNPLPSSIQP